MSHWAQVDENNIVIQVAVGDNNLEDEGYSWFIENIGGTWIKTSYNAKINGFRKNFAGIGHTWDEENDRFIPPKPYASWILNEEVMWEPPISAPDDGAPYMWDEETVSWKLID